MTVRRQDTADPGSALPATPSAIVSIFFVTGKVALAHRAAASEEAQEAAKGLVLVWWRPRWRSRRSCRPARVRFILALMALGASIVQAFLIIIRDALLIVLIGGLPLAAAASISPSGRQTWHKMIGWLIAFILFKPVAAMCYAGALWSVTNASNEIDQIAGIFLVIWRRC